MPVILTDIKKGACIIYTSAFSNAIYYRNILMRDENDVHAERIRRIKSVVSLRYYLDDKSTKA